MEENFNIPRKVKKLPSIDNRQLLCYDKTKRGVLL